MSHYDDLQRFKDKTRTQNLMFKELSTQSSLGEHGDWALLNQLSPSRGVAPSLGVGGIVSRITPQPVADDAFIPHDVPPLRAAPSEVSEVPPSIKAESALSSPIMKSVSDYRAPAPVKPDVSATPAAPVKEMPAPDPLPPLSKPKPAVPPDRVNYSRLFAAKNSEKVDKAGKEEKDQPLKSLLERIATCR